MTNLSLQPGGMDILLDRTIGLPHIMFVLFASLCPQGLVIGFIGIKGFWCSLTSRCPFRMVSASTEIIVYCHLDCRVFAARYAWRVLTNRDFAWLNDKDFLSAEHGHSKLWRAAVRAVVRSLSQLLPEGFCQSGCCQSGCCQSGCCHSGCCQSGCCQSGCCHSGCCQSGYCQSRSQASRQSKLVTKLLHSSVLVIYTARKLPKRKPWDNPKATQT